MCRIAVLLQFGYLHIAVRIGELRDPVDAVVEVDPAQRTGEWTVEIPTLKYSQPTRLGVRAGLLGVDLVKPEEILSAMMETCQLTPDTPRLLLPLSKGT